MVFTEGLGAMGGVQRRLGCKFNKLFSQIGIVLGVLLIIGPIIYILITYKSYKKENDKTYNTNTGTNKDTTFTDNSYKQIPWKEQFVVPIFCIIFGIILIIITMFKYTYKKEQCKIYSTMTEKQLRAGDTVRMGSNLAYGAIHAVGAASRHKSN